MATLKKKDFTFLQIEITQLYIILLLSFTKNEASVNISSSLEASMEEEDFKYTQNPYYNASAYWLGSHDGINSSSSFHFIDTESISNQTKLLYNKLLSNEVLNSSHTVTSKGPNSSASGISNQFGTLTGITKAIEQPCDSCPSATIFLGNTGKLTQDHNSLANPDISMTRSQPHSTPRTTPQSHATLNGNAQMDNFFSFSERNIISTSLRDGEIPSSVSKNYIDVQTQKNLMVQSSLSHTTEQQSYHILQSAKIPPFSLIDAASSTTQSYMTNMQLRYSSFVVDSSLDATVSPIPPFQAEWNYATFDTQTVFLKSQATKKVHQISPGFPSPLYSWHSTSSNLLHFNESQTLKLSQTPLQMLPKSQTAASSSSLDPSSSILEIETALHSYQTVPIQDGSHQSSVAELESTPIISHLPTLSSSVSKSSVSSDPSGTSRRLLNSIAVYTTSEATLANSSLTTHIKSQNVSTPWTHGLKSSLDTSYASPSSRTNDIFNGTSPVSTYSRNLNSPSSVTKMQSSTTVDILTEASSGPLSTVNRLSLSSIVTSIPDSLPPFATFPKIAASNFSAIISDFPSFPTHIIQISSAFTSLISPSTNLTTPMLPIKPRTLLPSSPIGWPSPSSSTLKNVVQPSLPSETPQFLDSSASSANSLKSFQLSEEAFHWPSQSTAIIEKSAPSALAHHTKNKSSGFIAALQTKSIPSSPNLIAQKFSSFASANHEIFILRPSVSTSLTAIAQPSLSPKWSLDTAHISTVFSSMSKPVVSYQTSSSQQLSMEALDISSPSTVLEDFSTFDTSSAIPGSELSPSIARQHTSSSSQLSVDVSTLSSASAALEKLSPSSLITTHPKSELSISTAMSRQSTTPRMSLESLDMFSKSATTRCSFPTCSELSQTTTMPQSFLTPQLSADKLDTSSSTIALESLSPLYVASLPSSYESSLSTVTLQQYSSLQWSLEKLDVYLNSRALKHSSSTFTSTSHLSSESMIPIATVHLSASPKWVTDTFDISPSSGTLDQTSFLYTTKLEVPFPASSFLPLSLGALYTPSLPASTLQVSSSLPYLVEELYTISSPAALGTFSSSSTITLPLRSESALSIKALQQSSSPLLSVNTIDLPSTSSLLDQLTFSSAPSSPPSSESSISIAALQPFSVNTMHMPSTSEVQEHVFSSPTSTSSLLRSESLSVSALQLSTSSQSKIGSIYTPLSPPKLELSPSFSVSASLVNSTSSLSTAALRSISSSLLLMETLGISSPSIVLEQLFSPSASTLLSISEPSLSVIILQSSSSLQPSVGVLNRFTSSSAFEKTSFSSTSTLPTTYQTPSSSRLEEDVLDISSISAVKEQSFSTSPSSSESFLTLASLHSYSLPHTSLETLDISSLASLYASISTSNPESSLPIATLHQHSSQQVALGTIDISLKSTDLKQLSPLSISTSPPSFESSILIPKLHSFPSLQISDGKLRTFSPSTATESQCPSSTSLVATYQASSIQKLAVNTAGESSTSTVHEDLFSPVAPSSPQSSEASLAMPTLQSPSSQNLPVGTLDALLSSSIEQEHFSSITTLTTLHQVFSSQQLAVDTVHMSSVSAVKGYLISSLVLTSPPSSELSTSIQPLQSASSAHLSMEKMDMSSVQSVLEKLTSSYSPTFLPSPKASPSRLKLQPSLSLLLSVDNSDKLSSSTTRETLSSPSILAPSSSSELSLPIATLQPSLPLLLSIEKFRASSSTAMLKPSLSLPLSVNKFGAFSPTVTVENLYSLSTVTSLSSSESSLSRVAWEKLSSKQLSTDTINVSSTSTTFDQLSFSSTLPSSKDFESFTLTPELHSSSLPQLLVNTTDVFSKLSVQEQLSSAYASTSPPRYEPSLLIAAIQSSSSPRSTVEELDASTSLTPLEQLSSLSSLALSSSSESGLPTEILQQSSSALSSVNTVELPSTSTLLDQLSSSSALASLPLSESSFSMPTLLSSSLPQSPVNTVKLLSTPMALEQLSSSFASTSPPLSESSMPTLLSSISTQSPVKNIKLPSTSTVLDRISSFSASTSPLLSESAFSIPNLPPSSSSQSPVNTIVTSSATPMIKESFSVYSSSFPQRSESFLSTAMLLPSSSPKLSVEMLDASALATVSQKLSTPLFSSNSIMLFQVLSSPPSSVGPLKSSSSSAGHEYWSALSVSTTLPNLIPPPSIATVQSFSSLQFSVYTLGLPSIPVALGQLSPLSKITASSSFKSFLPSAALPASSSLQFSADTFNVTAGSTALEQLSFSSTAAKSTIYPSHGLLSMTSELQSTIVLHSSPDALHISSLSITDIRKSSSTLLTSSLLPYSKSPLQALQLSSSLHPSSAVIQTRSSTLPASFLLSDYQSSSKSPKASLWLDSSLDTLTLSLFQTASAKIWPSSISSVIFDISSSSLTSYPFNNQSIFTPTLNTTASSLLKSEISGSFMGDSIGLLKDKTIEFTQASTQASISVSPVPDTYETVTSTLPKPSTWTSHAINAQSSSYIKPVFYSQTDLPFSTTTHAYGLPESVHPQPSSPRRSVIALDTVASRTSLEQTTSLTNFVKGALTISTNSKKPMAYSSNASGGSTKQPLINLSSSKQTHTATAKYHVATTSDVYSQRNVSQNTAPPPVTSIEASDHYQSSSLIQVGEPIVTEITSSTRATYLTSINKVSDAGVSLSTHSTSVLAVSITNAQLLSTGPISAETKITKPFASMLSVHPYGTEIDLGPHSSAAKYSFGNAPAPLPTLATETSIYSERVQSEIPFISKLKSSMFESYKSAVSQSSKSSLLEFSATTSVSKPLIESAGADSPRIQSMESSVLEVNKLMQTTTQAHFEANSQLEKTESSRFIPETVYPTPEKQISAIEDERNSHTAEEILSLVSETSFEKSAVQSTKYQRMSVTKDSSQLSPTNNESKIMTVEILHRSKAAKNISSGSFTSLLNSSQTITQLNTNNHTIRPSPSSSTGTSSQASSSSSVATQLVIPDGEEITKNMEMQIQLGNTIEMNKQTVEQSEALQLLQEPRSDMRLRVERALTSLVRESMQDNDSLLRNLIGCAGFSFRKGSIIATFRIVFKKAAQISDPNMVANAVKDRVQLLKNNSLVKDNVAIFVEPTKIQIKDFDECKQPAGTFCHINAECENSPTIFSFSCTCINGYQGNGTHCTPMKANQESSDNSTTGIVIAVILGVAVIVIVLFACACVKKGNLRAKVRDARIHLHLYPREAWSEV